MNTTKAIATAKELYLWIREKYVEDCHNLGVTPDENLVQIDSILAVNKEYTAKTTIIDVLEKHGGGPMNAKDIALAVSKYPIPQNYPENTIRTQLNMHSDKVNTSKEDWDPKKPFLALGNGMYELKDKKSPKQK